MDHALYGLRIDPNHLTVAIIADCPILFPGLGGLEHLAGFEDDHIGTNRADANGHEDGKNQKGPLALHRYEPSEWAVNREYSTPAFIEDRVSPFPPPVNSQRKSFEFLMAMA
jgi:hypothetical protein